MGVTFFPAKELFGTPPLAFLLTGLEVLPFFTGLSSVLQLYSKNNMYINSHVFTTTISKHLILLLGLSTLIDLYRHLYPGPFLHTRSCVLSSESSSSYLPSSLLHSSRVPEIFYSSNIWHNCLPNENIFTSYSLALPSFT